ncbi:MAG TPA: HAD family phosphatase [Candidatus Paceibacterota bacterium]|nr:HAD family phosphatase [Candidatus Paceibacterota bacterium]
MGFEAVIFDNDGVLVPTLMDAYYGAQAVRKAFGCEMSDPGTYFKESGAVERYIDYLRIGVPSHVSDKEIWRIYREASDNRPVKRAYPGAIELVASLRSSGKKVAVVSACAQALTERKLADVGLLNRFDLVIGGACPKTEAFKMACEQFGVRTDKAVLIEDSPSGIREGVALGLRCIGRCSLVSPTPEALASAGACRVVSSLVEIFPFLSCKAISMA